MHHAIVVAMETLYRERLDDHLEALARHALGARLWAQAVRHLRRAAARAIERSAYQQASTLIKQAVETIKKFLIRDRQWIELEIDLRLLLSISLGALGLYREKLST